jgi:hypothetical protein
MSNKPNFAVFDLEMKVAFEKKANLWRAVAGGGRDPERGGAADSCCTWSEDRRIFHASEMSMDANSSSGKGDVDDPS